MMQTLPAQARPLPQNRIIVSARFLKPIKEPCTIFVVANRDVLNPAMRLLIHQRMMDQFERILEMITEKMGLRILGGVRSLYTYEGHQVTDGSKLECGQLYVAVGRERFKKLPYSDLLFTRPKGTRRIRGMKAHSLPPIYRFSKQSGNSKSPGRSSDSGDGDSKASPPNHCGSSKEDLTSTVREISQARLLTLRKKKSGQSITADSPDNDVREPQADRENTERETSQDQRAEEKSDASDGQRASKEDSENTEEEPCSENATETEGPTSKDDREHIQDTNVAKEEEEKKEADEQNDEKEGGGTAMNEQKVEEVKEVKDEVRVESKNEVDIEDPASTSSPVDDKPQDNKELEEASSEAKKEQDDDTEEDKQERAGGNGEESSNGHSNDADMGEERKETENGNMPGETQSDNEEKGSGATRSSSRTSNQEEDVITSKDDSPIESGKEEKINREMNGKVETEVEPETN
ncbi:doublecortin domain-containing protein 2 isoform X2 [Xiphophorus hellerii]|nr:doublecortin domain-containing protein 2 isoform X2 [Xiphophorus hellerii]